MAPKKRSAGKKKAPKKSHDKKMPPKKKAKRKGEKLDSAGGEVIQVTVRVNGKLVFVRNASMLISGRYMMCDGSDVKHERASGPISLARKMLKRL